MSQPLNRPLFSRTFAAIEEVPLGANSVYVVGDNLEIEDRAAQWEALADGETRIARVTEASQSGITVELEAQLHKLRLREIASMSGFLSSLCASRLHIDLTGLPMRVWAPLVRAALDACLPVSAVYIEPGDYRYSTSPIEGQIFDLSERIDGISPIPGFATLVRADHERSLFVPILGFEGTRLAHILETIQPKNENVWPVVPVPGTRVQFPFFSYLANKGQLVDTHSWKAVLYSRANCPFSLYHLLCSQFDDQPELQLVLAPLGPKPQALGAILYYLDHRDRVELVYDHPISRRDRTVGAPRVCTYDLSAWADCAGYGHAVA